MATTSCPDCGALLGGVVPLLNTITAARQAAYDTLVADVQTLIAIPAVAVLSAAITVANDITTLNGTP